MFCYRTDIAVDSTPAVLATWEFYAKEYNLDLTEVLKSRSHTESRLCADNRSLAWSSNQGQYEKLVWYHRRCCSRCECPAELSVY